MQTLWVGSGTSTLQTSKPFLARETIAAAMEDVTSNGCCLIALTILPGIKLTKTGDEIEVEGGGVLTETGADLFGAPGVPTKRGRLIPGADPKPVGLKVKYATYGPKTGGRKTRRKMSRAYCRKTPCRRMGFTQKASCRPYTNCYRKEG